MPLKTKPTTRLERRLLRQVAELQAVVTAHVRDKNQALTELRQNLRRDYDRQMEVERQEVVLGVKADITEGLMEQRVRDRVAIVLMDAAAQEAQYAEDFTKRYTAAGIPIPSATEVFTRSSGRLMELVQMVANT